MSTELQSEAGGAAVEVLENDFAALLQKEFKPNTDAKKSRIEQAVQTLAAQALGDAKVIGDDIFLTIEGMIAALDRKLTEQINPIIHHPDFQQLESSWRGLNYLVMNTPTGKDLKIRVLNISKDETRKMLRPGSRASLNVFPDFRAG